MPETVPVSMPRSGELEATPDLTGRRKIRIPLDMSALAAAAQEQSLLFEVSLRVGGVPVDREAFRLLHSRAEWNGHLEPRLDGLLFAGGKGNASPEQPVFLLPREDDSAYRRFNLPLLGGKGAAGEALFLGDPWVEPAEEPPATTGAGLSTRLAARTPRCRWAHACVSGPHRGYYIFRLVAAADRFIRSAQNARIPPLVVVSLGAGDMIRQTPGYDFQRGLDLLVDRLRKAGAQRIFVVGVLPLPDQDKASILYRDRVAETIRNHHLESLDLVAIWLKSPDWTRRFLIPGPEGSAPAYAPVPNAETLDEIARQIAERIE